MFVTRSQPTTPERHLLLMCPMQSSGTLFDSRTCATEGLVLTVHDDETHTVDFVNDDEDLEPNHLSMTTSSSRSAPPAMPLLKVIILGLPRSGRDQFGLRVMTRIEGNNGIAFA